MKNRNRSLGWRSLALITCLLAAATANAQTGVSDDRVSLPDGPGSLDGVGDNASINGNMGLMAFSVPISVPSGVNGIAPSLGLGYSSGGGNGSFGMGWSMPIPFVERMTSKGLPEYVNDDRFVADGSNELVRVSDAEPAVYRARFEGGFVRYSWHGRGAGDEGYWTAEFPNGAISYFGADRTGTPVETARVRSPDGVFRYLVVDSLDRFGNRITYDYRYYGSVPLLDFVGWVYRADGTPRFSAQFDYEAREDPISDARGGFNEKTAHRATDIRVFSEATQIRRYSLTYEDYATSGGVSRLLQADRYGADGELYGVRYSMEYSRALAGVCDGVECDAPILVNAGSIGAGFATGNVNLIDLNGDSIPDAVYTPPTGPHRIYLGEMDPVDGGVSFASPFDSAVGDSGTFEMSSPYTQILDYDGDGFTDFLDALSGRVLVNKGTGDWDSQALIGGDVNGTLPDFSEDFALDGENELSHIRFLDADGDRKIDVLRSDSIGTSLFRNLGANGFASVPVEQIEAAFSEDATDLADVNGDGLLDPVQLRDGSMRYRLNLGRGKWAQWADMADMPFDLAEVEEIELEDLNGDGLDDVVLVQGSSVRYALNRNNAEFSPEETVTSAGGQPLPNVDGTVTVLFADMNANGSNDVVWVDDNGNMTFLDLFPVRPHLLSRIQNGIGYTVDIAYGSMARERARDGGEGWDHAVPMATLVVTSMDVYTEASDASLIEHDVVSYAYRGGFYDGDEKQFRGFETSIFTQETEEGAFVATTTYDVGVGDNRGHFAGLEIAQETVSGGRAIQISSTTYGECAVADVPVTTPPILWVCELASSLTSQEGAPESEWATLREEKEYDGYGNVVRTINHGVVDIGGNGCPACERASNVTGAPCGAQCLGDEAYAEVDFIPLANLGGRYQSGLTSETRDYAIEGGVTGIERYYYDGNPFVGLELGQATDGVMVRHTQERGGGQAPIEVQRQRVDTFGNVVEELRPGAPIDGPNRAELFFSVDGRDLLRVEQTLEGKSGQVTLATDYSYDTLFGKVASFSGEYVTGDDPSEQRKFWTYDEHGRLASHVDPGNSIAEPSETYEYELSAPYSRFITKRRSEIGGPLDIEYVSCVDGLGRELQKRSTSGDGRYFVSGYSVLDRAGNAVRTYRPYTADNNACEAPPDDVKFTEIAYDGMDREIQVTLPDGDEWGGVQSVRRTEYLPLGTRYFNEDDTDPDADGFDTPTVTRVDGQGRIVATERMLPAGGIERFVVTYDDLGRIRGFVDPEGNEKSQRYDLADRVVEVNDPDAGQQSFEFSESGDLIRTVDGRGAVVERAYDSLGRKIEEWDGDDRDGTLVEFYYDRHPDCPSDSCTFTAGRFAGSKSNTRLGEIIDGAGYDANGDSTHHARQIRGVTLRMDIVLDNAGRVIEESYTGGHKLEFDVDALDRPTSVSGVINAIDYTDSANVAGWSAANGIRTNFGYDSRDRLTSITAGNNLDLVLGRDRISNIVGIEDRVATGAVSAAATYTLDSLSRLTGAEFGDETLTIATDAMLRTTSKTSSRGATSPAHAGTYTYGTTQPRSVTDAGGVAIDYDTGGYATSHGDSELSYDRNGRVQRIEQRGASVLDIDRDGFGYRAVANLGSEERLYLGKVLEVRDGITRLKVKVGEDVVAIQESASQAAMLLGIDDVERPVTAADAFQASESEIGTLLRSGARRLLLEVAGEQRFLHSDHLGSTLAVSDEGGAVVERIAYYPFGAIRGSSAVETEMASFGGVDHEGTGFLDYRNRVLSPREGRWLSADPGFVMLDSTAFETPVEAFSGYAFVSNNPTSSIDIDGLINWSRIGKIAIKAVGLGLAIAGVALMTGATLGIANTIGAIAGGIVGAGFEIRAQRNQLKQTYGGRKIPLKAKLGALLSVAVATATGSLSGFATGGISVVGSAMRGTADVVESRPNAGKKSRIAAGVLRVVGTAVSLGSGATLAAGGASNTLGGARTVSLVADTLKTSQGAAAGLIIGGSVAAGGVVGGVKYKQAKAAAKKKRQKAKTKAASRNADRRKAASNARAKAKAKKGD